jgi:hypothetical protein
MTPPLKSLILAALVVLAAAAVPATASAATMKQARFRVTVSGVQKTTWTYASESADPDCPTKSNGSGSETVRFRTPKSRVLRITQFGKLPAIFQFEGQRSPLPTTTVAGSVSRNGTYDTQITGECRAVAQGDNESPEAPPAPDCGTKRFGALGIDLHFVGRSWFWIERDDLHPLTEPFQNCPIMGTEFPELLSTSKGKQLQVRLPQRDLFNRRFGKHIVIGRGRESSNAGGARVVTTIRWDVTLRRLKSRKR